jgi:hypothetical protein
LGRRRWREGKRGKGGLVTSYSGPIEEDKSLIFIVCVCIS